jgi:hypothetical protein
MGHGGWSLTTVSHSAKANRCCPRKVAGSGHAAAVGLGIWFLFVNFVNVRRNCKHESCVPRKVMKLCSLQLFHLMPFRALKSNLYLARYNMRRKEIEYEHMYPVCPPSRGTVRVI